MIFEFSLSHELPGRLVLPGSLSLSSGRFWTLLDPLSFSILLFLIRFKRKIGGIGILCI